MHINCNRTALLKELQLCASVVEKRSTIPILSNVKFEAADGVLNIAATDLDVTVKTSCPATVEKSGGITGRADEIVNGIRAASGETVTIEGGGVGDAAFVSVQCGTSRFRIGAYPVEDYPTVPESPSGDELTLDGPAFRAAIKAASYAQSSEVTRFQLNGVCVTSDKRRLDLVSTDGNRLALVSLGGKYPQANLLLPSKIVRAFERIEGSELRLSVSANGDRRGDHIAVAGEGPALFIARTLDVNFPKYREVIASDLPHRALIDRARFAAAIRAVTLFANPRTRAAKFSFAPGRLTISVQNPEDAQEASDYLPIEYAGPAFFVGIASNYVAQALEAVDSEQIEFRAKDEQTQIHIRPVTEQHENVESLHVIMSMRLA